MNFKVFNVEFDGIDKVGKDSIMKQIFVVAPNKYIPKARGIMSQLAYSDMNNRNYNYEVSKGYLENTLIVYLTVDKDDWLARCNLSGEFKSNKNRYDMKDNIALKYETHTAAFDKAFDTLKNSGIDEKHFMKFNTSELTPYKIITEVIKRLDELNEEV